MKNISPFSNEKYAGLDQIETGVYLVGGRFLTPLCFEQEPEFGEGSNAADLSQYPLEDVLDKYSVFVSDFFANLNTKDSRICYLEFAAFKLEDIRVFRNIIGKHIFNRRVREKNKDYVELVMENAINGVG